jgi:hypothetical protein
VRPTLVSGNADFAVTMTDAGGSVIFATDPLLVASASIDLPSLPAGTYYLSIAPRGWGDFASGYTSYGSVGAYDVIGAFPGDGAGDTGPNDPGDGMDGGGGVTQDTTPPTTSIISPSSGATVRKNRNINIKATAADDQQLVEVSIAVNGSRICTVAVVRNQDVTCSYRTPATAGTALSITSTATDAANLSTTSSAVNVVVGNR